MVTATIVGTQGRAFQGLPQAQFCHTTGYHPQQGRAGAGCVNRQRPYRPLAARHRQLA